MKHIFIINPCAGLVDKTEYVRAELKKRSDIEAIVFNTEEAGHETALMREMLEIFDDEEVRIYICGGSGTFSKALDALDVEELDHVEVAFFPCGLTNDFIKNFGYGALQFDDFNALIKGKCMHADYMRCVIDGDDKNVRNNVLFVTVGIMANIERVSRFIKFVGGISPAFMYGIGTALTLPFTPAVDYEVIIDGKDYSREYKLIYIGNGFCCGGGFIPIKYDVDCKDGILNVLLLKRIPPLNFIKYFKEFMNGELPDKRQNDAEVIRCKELYVRRKDSKAMCINADGEIYNDISWHVKVVNNRLKLVVPDGVKFATSHEEVMEYLYRRDKR